MENTSRHCFVTRYRDIKDGIEYSGTRLNMSFKTKETDSFHNVTEGERIDLIAYRYYGDCSLWWIIADANDIVNPLRLSIGQRLRIPSKSTVYMELQ